MARVPHTGAMPAAMKVRLDSLREAIGALSSAPVARVPLCGSERPAALPIPKDLPPALAAAFIALQAALDGPPCLANVWPFATPPGLAARLTRARGGRVSKITAQQVIQLVKAVEAATPVKAAARQVGLGRHTAHAILAGRHPASRTAAVEAAGIFLPRNAAAAAETVSILVLRHQGKGSVATKASSASSEGGCA